MCPVGCNVSVTTREGQVKRIQSRNHPEIDEGWLCDKGRYAYAHLDAPDRIKTPLRKAGPRRFEAISWDEAIDYAAELLRSGGASTVTALSGGESVEEAYALAMLMRRGLGAHNAVLTEEPSEFGGSPLSALRGAKSIAVLCDVPVVERAPIVDLWLKAARRAGATISFERPTGAVDAIVTDDPVNVGLVEATHVYVLPFTPNGRGVADAWSAAGDEDPADEKPRILLISGDEAATNADVRALAAEAEFVIGIGLFEESFRSFADLVLPGTSYLERDGTTVNLEGRLQRQRRAVLAPVPDMLAWISKLGEKFGVKISPHTSVVFDEISERCYGGVTFADLGRQAGLPRRVAPSAAPDRPSNTALQGKGLRLIAYKPLFSGPAVDRTPELQFQRPGAEVELSPEDARSRGVRNGATVTVASNGTSVELRARIARDLAAGAVRIPQDHAADLHPVVEVTA
jgi:predicted molibdopterin-dependent oxidoreductase YjgC